MLTSGTPGWNVLVDVVLAILPITFFWRLKFTWQKKAALCTLLGLGITAAIFAAIKTSYLACLDARSDLTCTSQHPIHICAL